MTDTPTPQMTPEQRAMDAIKQAIADVWGDRCDDYDATCNTCAAWKWFDASCAAQTELKAADAQIELLLKNHNGLTAEIARLTAALATAREDGMREAERDVIAERRRQTDSEGWTPDHDDAYFPGKLAQAGACYAMNAGASFFANRPPSGWPFTTKWWKPTTPRRDLVKAAALILAEIERLDRAAIKKGSAT